MITNNKAVVLIALGSILFAGIFLYSFYVQPYDIGPKQPIPFSHNVHSGIKQIQCQFCHPYVAYSTFPGIPPVEKCLYCHMYIVPNYPWIQEEHRYFNLRRSTPWVKVNYIPEHVLFNHQRHINTRIECAECHGPVEHLQRLPEKVWRMGMCVECHRTKKASVDCWQACHN